MSKKKLPRSVTTTGRDIQVDDGDVVEHDERMVPEFHKGHQLYGEHISRYEAAKPIVAGKTVLDIASGSGYGTEQLARTAKKVIGVDISENAIQYAQTHYSAKNIQYIRGDGNSIPVDDQSVEIVTSFETIEHIPDYKNFLSEVKRVLQNEGLFIISTPNDKEFTEGNHFHLHEFHEEELASLLKKKFKYVERYYQTTWFFSLIGDKNSFTQEWIKNMYVMQTTTIPQDRVLYFYFLCSDSPIDKTPQLLGTIGELWSEREYRNKTKLTANHIDNLETLLGAQKARSNELENALRVANKRVSQLENAPLVKLMLRLKRAVKRR